jgi:hypothetical protein
MRQMARGVLLLALLAGASFAAQAAVTPVDLGSSSNDFRIILNDPTCSGGPGCIQLSYSGPPTFFLFFPADPPFTVTPSNPPGCGTNIVDWKCRPIVVGGTFDGVLFYDDIFEGIHLITSINGGFDLELSGLPSIDLGLPNGVQCVPASSCPSDVADIVTTPELPTFALFGTGLLLVFGGMFWRRRLSLHAAARDRAAVPVPQA